MFRKKSGHNKKNEGGATLLEMLVAVAIFSATMVSATGIFQLAINGQQNIKVAQNIQESMRYAFEVISKELRSAQPGDGVWLTGTQDCSGNGQVLYQRTSNNQLDFKNVHNDCVRYYIRSVPGTDYFEITRGGGAIGRINPADVGVIASKLTTVDYAADQQGRVTLSLQVEGRTKEIHKQTNVIQTTVSSRYYTD